LDLKAAGFDLSSHSPARLPKAWATRINVPIVRFRGSFSIAEISGALISAFAASTLDLRLSTLPPLYLYSEVAMLAIRLPQSIEKRLEKLARRTGRTKTFYVREAILEHLDDLEDFYLAEKSFDRIQKGEEQTVPLEELLK
jgi:RHH-type rel operon transcriptional repressor/antitoxin RelB